MRRLSRYPNSFLPGRGQVKDKEIMNSKFKIQNLQFTIWPELPFVKARASEPLDQSNNLLVPERDEVFNSFFPYRGVRGIHFVKSLRKGVIIARLNRIKRLFYFSALLTGNRNTNSNYNNRGTNTNLWSSTVGVTGAWKRNLNSGYSEVNRNDNSKAYGFSVRCLKDWLKMIEMLPEPEHLYIKKTRE